MTFRQKRFQSRQQKYEGPDEMQPQNWCMLEKRIGNKKKLKLRMALKNSSQLGRIELSRTMIQVPSSKPTMQRREVSLSINSGAQHLRYSYYLGQQQGNFHVKSIVFQGCKHMNDTGKYLNDDRKSNLLARDRRSCSKRGERDREKERDFDREIDKELFRDIGKQTNRETERNIPDLGIILKDHTHPDYKFLNDLKEKNIRIFNMEALENRDYLRAESKRKPRGLREPSNPSQSHTQRVMTKTPKSHINPYTKKEYLHFHRKGSEEHKKEVERLKRHNFQSNMLKPCQIFQKELRPRQPFDNTNVMLIRPMTAKSITHRVSVRVGFQTLTPKGVDIEGLRPWDQALGTTDEMFQF